MTDGFAIAKAIEGLTRAVEALVAAVILEPCRLRAARDEIEEALAQARVLIDGRDDEPNIGQRPSGRA